MNSAKILLLILSNLILISIIYQYINDQKLLKTVTKNYRGTRTERLMVLKLLKFGIPSKAIFHDLYLKKGGANYCQIDLVVATKVGILVFEIKKLNGWIFGLENQTHWTQVLGYGKYKYRFYNPILQNEKHIVDLKNQLSQFNEVPFYSVIVVFGNCSFRNLEYVPHNTYLVKSSGAIEVVKKILEQNDPTIFLNKREIVDLLNSAVLNGESDEIKSTHINNIKRNFRNY